MAGRHLVFRNYSLRAVSVGSTLLFCSLMFATLPRLPGAFAAAVAVLGAGLVLGCRGIALDRSSGRVFEWWGPSVPLWRRDIPVEGFSHVGVHEEWDEYQNDSRPYQRSYSTHYTVKLQRPAASWDPHEPDQVMMLNLRRFTKLERARKVGREVAGILSLPLEDYTADPNAAPSQRARPMHGR